MIRDSSTRHILFGHINALDCEAVSLDEFHSRTGIVYTSELIIDNDAILRHARRRIFLGRRQGFFDPQRKWLGKFHYEAISSGEVADLSIRIINEKVGYGVFAETPIEEGEYIGVYTGKLIRRDLFRRRVNDYCFRYPTGAEGIFPLMIDAGATGNELRFINHADVANVEAIGVPWKDLVQVIFRASRNILKGGQLFYDYGYRYWLTEKRSKTPLPARISV